MVGPSHLVIGFAATVLVDKLTGIEPTAFQILLALIGSLAPDIDGGGTIARPSGILKGVIPKGLRGLIDAIGIRCSRIIQATVGHRGFFHWPLLALVIIAISFRTGSHELFWFGIGYLSHILADVVTVEGVPFFAPIMLRKVSVGLMRTGSFVELLLVAVIAVGACIVGFTLLPVEVQKGIVAVKQVVVSQQK